MIRKPARMARILMLSADLSGNPTLTPWQFAGALAGHASVIAGPASREIWKPLADHAFTVLPSNSPRDPAVHRAVLAAAADCDLIYAFKAVPMTLGLALWLRRRLGKPVALHLDDYDAAEMSALSWPRQARALVSSLRQPDGAAWVRLCEPLIPRVDFLTVSSRALQRRYGGAVVRQGVDTDACSPARFPREEARRRLKLRDDDFLVLFLGTPRLHKGLAMLPAALRGNMRCMIVGADSSVPSIQEALRGLGDVTLQPPVSFHDAAWYLSACDAFPVLQQDTLYARHQFPAKIAHAMALGAPLVATTVGDAEELLGGDPPAGLLIPPGDGDALASALRRLSDDPALGRRLGAEARRRADASLGWRVMAARLEEIVPLGRRHEGPDVSAVTISYNTARLTAQACRSVARQRGVTTETIVVDNASRDDSVAAVRAAGARVIVNAENVGFGRACNQAMQVAGGRYFLLVNSDARFEDDDGLVRMVALMDARPRLGVLGPRIVGESGRVQPTARRFPSIAREALRRFGLYRLLGRARAADWLLADFWAHDTAREVDWVVGACMLVRRAAFHQTDGFDPRIFLYGEEQEWAWRIRRAGWTVAFDPSVTVVHQRGASAPDRDAWRTRLALEGDWYFAARHGSRAFIPVRAVGLAFEAIVFGLRNLLHPAPYLQDRFDAAWLELREWLGIGLRRKLAAREEASVPARATEEPAKTAGG